MGSHPVNLAIRFALELAALAGMGMWGWQQGQGATRYVIGLGTPLIAATLWGTFAVPDDPSRSAVAPVPIGGMLRLGIEFAFFAFAVWAFHANGKTGASVILAMAIAAHYAVSYDRVAWLLRTRHAS